MGMNLVRVREDGQLEFDFESLEALTSKKLVEFIREKYEGENKKIVRLEVVRNDEFVVSVRGIFNYQEVFQLTYMKRIDRVLQDYEISLSSIKTVYEWLNQ